MHEKLDKKLCKDFPLLYANRHGDMRETCMVWGFEIKDGWFKLVYELSSKLELLIAQYIEDEKAKPILDEGSTIDNSKSWWPRADQVKEKFGTLRFYLTYGTDEMFQLINEAEDKSALTCEVCGQPGVLRGGGWMFCACDKHCKENAPLNNDLF